VEVRLVSPEPNIINSNGATNFRGQLIFTGEGQGEDIAPALYLMNPKEPYNSSGWCSTSSRWTTANESVLINNFYGRQFNSLNDVAINPRNGEIYFTDSLYGYRQDFRPPPGIPTLVYRLNADTGAVSAVADLFDAPNGK
jgi:gluconolactonase